MELISQAWHLVTRSLALGDIVARAEILAGIEGKVQPHQLQHTIQKIIC